MATVLDGEDIEHAVIAESSIGVLLLGGFQAAHNFHSLSKKSTKGWKSYMKCVICPEIQGKTQNWFKGEKKLCLKTTQAVRQPNIARHFLFWGDGESGQVAFSSVQAEVPIGETLT